jgi:hypothetical protein
MDHDPFTAYTEEMSEMTTVESPVRSESAGLMRTHSVPGGGGLRLHVREWGNPDARAILFIHGCLQAEGHGPSPFARRGDPLPRSRRLTHPCPVIDRRPAHP